MYTCVYTTTSNAKIPSTMTNIIPIMFISTVTAIMLISHNFHRSGCQFQRNTLAKALSKPVPITGVV